MIASRRNFRSVALVASPMTLWMAGAAAYNAGVHMPGCPFKTLTSLDCPGCGSTRAGASLLRGDLSAALDHNALLVSAPLVMLLFWIAQRLVPQVRPAWSWLSLRPAAVTLILICGFWFLRLLPLQPLTFLASGRL